MNKISKSKNAMIRTWDLAILNANRYTMTAGLWEAVKFRNKLYISYFIRFMAAKIPVAARDQTTIFGHIIT